MTPPPRLRLTVNLDAIADNWRWLARQAAGATCAAAVKANAYGLGMDLVAPRLAHAGCTTFFVATLSEGVHLRSVLPDAVIYVLDGVRCPADCAAMASSGLVPVLNSFQQIALWQPLNGPCGVMIDTGINRLGISYAQAHTVNIRHLNVVLWLSHLASADDAASPQNQHQLERFVQSRPAEFPTPASLANSAAILLGDAYHFDMVRPGIALYGGQTGLEGARKPQQVLSAHACVLQVSDIPAGATVGYNATWTARRPTRVATLGIGYADGYLRGFSNTGQVYLDGTLCPVIGRVSMDLTMIDVTAVPQAQAGDFAEVLGPNVSLADAARASGLSQYELLTCLGSRYERRYLCEGA